LLVPNDPRPPQISHVFISLLLRLYYDKFFAASVIDPLQQTQYRNWQKGEEIVAGLNLHFFFCKESNLKPIDIVYIIDYVLSLTIRFIIIIPYRKEIEAIILQYSSKFLKHVFGCSHVKRILKNMCEYMASNSSLLNGIGLFVGSKIDA